MMSAYHGPEGQEDMPYLLTAGPVTTSRAVRIAMLADYSASSDEFISVVRFIRKELLRIAGCTDSHDCVLVHGPENFAIEAAVGTFCPVKRKKTLVICNGPDGERAAQVLDQLGRPFVRLSLPETTRPSTSDVAKALDDNRAISHVWLTHMETSSGIVNAVHDIAEVVKAKGCVMMLDAVASFGGIALNMMDDNIDVLVSTGHRCMESVPGISFVLARRQLLETADGQSHSPALDLHAEWVSEKATGHWRASPATHVVVALQEALRELEAEGGVSGRSRRYLHNTHSLRERLKALGFSMLLSDVEASAIVQTILAPHSATYDFKRFHDALYQKGFAIAAGTLAHKNSFRIGCIGGLDEKIMQQVVAAIDSVMQDMDVRDFAPEE